MESRPTVIILNGCGSVGKTSTALALQKITRQPFLHLSMDSFIAMLPAAMFGHPDGLVFETVEADGKPSVVIRSGPVMARLMHGMRHAIAAMAAQGNNLIVDDVMLGEAEARQYLTLLFGTDLRLVGLFAPLEIIEARELARGDRAIGLARWQFDRVHRGIAYDLELDTSASDPARNAEAIRAAFAL